MAVLFYFNLKFRLQLGYKSQKSHTIVARFRNNMYLCRGIQKKIQSWHQQ